MSLQAEKIIEFVQEAENGLLDAAPNEVVTGFAGEKLTGLIQRLTKALGQDYLEVGVFQGSSLLNTAFCSPNIHCYGVDNYAFLDPENQNKNIVLQRAEALGVTNFTLIDEDFEDALQGFDGKIGVYFIDGPHDYRSQLMCLVYGVRILEKAGCMLVDDANYAHVRQATKDFLVAFPEYKLVFEAYTDCHPHNMTDAQLKDARKGWWDGVHLIVHDPEDKFEGLVPPTPTNQQFVRDHEVQTGRYAAVAPEATKLVLSLTRPWQLPKHVARLAKGLSSKGGEIRGRFEYVNTDSKDLPARLAALKSNS